MNIGLFTDTYYPQVSGVATSISILRDTLEQMGHQVYIFTSNDPKVSRNVYERNIFRFPSFPFTGFPDRRLAYSGALHAVQIAKELNLDIVHTQTEFSMGLMGKFVAFSLKIPAIHTYHTMYQDYLHYVANGKLIGPRTVKTAVRNYLKNMEGVVAPSQLVYETMVAYGVTAPIRIIPTGVDVHHNVTAAQTQDLRQQLGLTAATPVALSLGRLAFEKNIEDTIDAFQAVLSKNAAAKLVIAGDGPARQSLTDHVDTLGISDSVIFTGMIEHTDVPRYYAMADVFVSSSQSESQGLTYLEALTAHTPIVVMNSPYVKDLITDPSIGVGLDDVDELAVALLPYLNKTAQVGDLAKRDAKINEVSAEHFGTEMLKFYEAVINEYQADDDRNSDSIFGAFSNPFKR
ncbi:glycosyltransferase family 4 protein [Periweissella ghanensis]|uniref:Alpha-monoglucosyldiacylglycerol synthase n=1 Tax=Periweissella ghanensis TaxID=467997 RepID=A0ABM8ZDE2_9LACO|nr:glycosyltransferase family 4 protein [Periweissella ghanensis]MCM0601590.1 glycosyltransferase family 4 protein [Periweissella ghanensis]CAH0418667.1 Alpha-monoglucosyldiacylglycerol synthase [Periweissella ghanensis]